MTTPVLPLPHLIEGRFASLDVYTDEALFERTGVRIAFTTRSGGVSVGAYDSLNLASHVDDDPACVKENRTLLLKALAQETCPLIVPSQVHGDHIVVIDDIADVDMGTRHAEQGADALTIGVSNVAALLCFADCVPVIAVSPTGRFSVIHAGWRGVENGIAAKAVGEMAAFESSRFGGDPLEWAREFNIYIGAYIHAECFETGDAVHRLFVDTYGSECAFDDRHIDLGRALRTQLEWRGVQSRRIADLGRCSVCDNETFFSFRAQGGIAGRHGALAVRDDRERR